MSNTPPDPELSEESPPTDSRRSAVQTAVETFLHQVRRVLTRGAPATDATPTPVLMTDGGQDDAKVIGHNKESGQTVGVWGEVDSSDGWGFATPDDIRIDGNVITYETDFIVEAGDQLTVNAQNVVLGHASNTVAGTLGVTIAGGGRDSGKTDQSHVVYDGYGTIGGGLNNQVGANDGATNQPYGTVAGGRDNTASGESATVGGGYDNTASGSEATVGGGFGNTASDDWATVAGGFNNTASGSEATVAGGRNNTASDDYATVAGGRLNAASGEEATVAGGNSNTARGEEATVAGGNSNTASGGNATVAGGDSNAASDPYATVGGGYQNTASDTQATVAGGLDNTASEIQATVAGGRGNTASGREAMIPGGGNNEASGTGSFAAGYKALATKDGSFVWNGSDEFDGVESPAPYTFSVQADNGIWLGTDYSPSIGSGRLIDTSTGAYLSDSGAWTDSCSVTEKERFTPTDSIDVLEKVDSLEVSTWQYRDDDGDARHMGPTAEQFHDTFGLGDDAHHIAPLDTAGVALTAIQGLSTQLDQKADRIDELQNSLDAKDDRIERLEADRDELQDDFDAKDDRIGELEAENDELRERLADIEAHLGLDDSEISTDD